MRKRNYLRKLKKQVFNSDIKYGRYNLIFLKHHSLLKIIKFLIIIFMIHFQPISLQSQSEIDRDVNELDGDDYIVNHFYPDKIDLNDFELRNRNGNTVRAKFILDNLKPYYIKYHYPLSFPEIYTSLKRTFIGGTNYRFTVNQEITRANNISNCFYNWKMKNLIKGNDLEDKLVEDYLIEECSRLSYNLWMMNHKEILKNTEQKEWRRSKCKNPDLLALIDFRYFLKKEDRLYRFCIEVKDQAEEETRIQKMKLLVFNLIQEPILKYPNQFSNFNKEENNYAEKIIELSNKLLIEYGNFESYTEIFPSIENPMYLNDDLFTDSTYHTDKLEKMRFHYDNLKIQEYTLLTEEINRHGGRFFLTYFKNKNILNEIKLSNDKIKNNKNISKKNISQFNQLTKCLHSIPNDHLSRLSLSYYSGLFKKYSLGEFVPENKKLVSINIIKIFDLFHKNFYNSKLLELRLENRLSNCEMIKKLNYEEFSGKKILKDICEINQNSDRECKIFQ
jgi:hypothetical protein